MVSSIVQIHWCGILGKKKEHYWVKWVRKKTISEILTALRKWCSISKFWPLWRQRYSNSLVYIEHTCATLFLNSGVYVLLPWLHTLVRESNLSSNHRTFVFNESISLLFSVTSFCILSATFTAEIYKIKT